MTTKIKRVIISILLALLFIFIILGAVYVATVYAEYAVIIVAIALPIGVLAEVIYNALSEY